MSLFSKKQLKESDCCRYCKNVTVSGDEYTCKYKGTVSASFVCKKYIFNPFASRVKRVRSLDTSMFDPLDFKLD